METGKPSKPTFNLTLEAMPGGPPPIIRLRHLLKAALRAYGFRCLQCVEVDGVQARAEGPGGKGTQQGGKNVNVHEPMPSLRG